MFSFSNFTTKTQKLLQHVDEDFATLRTGKASASMLDPVRVEAYGSKLSMQEVAQVSVPEPTMILVKPFDPNIVDSVASGIRDANLNLNPIVDGDQVRVPVPTLTEEKRKEMVKLLHQKLESSKTMLRSIRTETKQEIEDMEGESGVSKDDIYAWEEELNKKVKELEGTMEQKAKKKEEELMRV